MQEEIVTNTEKQGKFVKLLIPDDFQKSIERAKSALKSKSNLQLVVQIDSSDNVVAIALIDPDSHRFCPMKIDQFEPIVHVCKSI